MNERLLIQFSEIILGATAIICIAIIIMATLYDIRAIAQKKLFQSLTKRLDKSRQPSITILVYAHDNETTIIDCLESIRTSTYANYQIVIVDNASTDTTKKIATAYKRRHKKSPIAIISKKTPLTRVAILRASYVKIRGSELILTINASDKLTPSLLENAAVRFLANEELIALRLRPFGTLERTIANLPHQFIRLSKNMLLKATAKRAVTKENYLEPGIVVRSTILTPGELPNNTQVNYASTLLFTPQATPYYRLPPTESKMITALRAVILLMALSMTSYFFYTAAILQSNILLTLSWALVVLWLLSVIWSDEVISKSTKFELSTTVPFMYFLFYAHAVLYLLKIIWDSRKRISLPTVSFEALYTAIQLELYSTRF